VINTLKSTTIKNKMKKFIILFSILLAFSSCNEYQKAIKSDDIAKKTEVATKLYDKGKYLKAITLFEQIAPAYKGKPKADELFYMFAQSYYKSKQYYLSGYQFENFASSFPKSDKVEEATFLGAKSFSMLSPRYSLDQTDTDKALDKLQSFIDVFPNSQYLPEANAIIKDLKNKIEKKIFENAKQYNTISDHKAAIIALDNFISEYASTPFKEDALYYKLDSAYKLATNSVLNKMEVRLNNAKTAYSNLLKFNPETKHKNKANEMLASIEKNLQQFSK
jgi:outer membrane protein assembly factor BamD